MFREAESFAPVASRWAGYQIPPEVVYAVGTEESCWRNLCRHCRGGGPKNGRSAGYFSLTARCVEIADASMHFGIFVPMSGLGTNELVCDWTVAHPRDQVRILLQRLALHTREKHGDLWGALAAYGPEDGDRDYPASVRQVWRRAFPATWPKNGRLQKL